LVVVVAAQAFCACMLMIALPGPANADPEHMTVTSLLTGGTGCCWQRGQARRYRLRGVKAWREAGGGVCQCRQTLGVFESAVVLVWVEAGMWTCLLMILSPVLPLACGADPACLSSLAAACRALRLFSPLPCSGLYLPCVFYAFCLAPHYSGSSWGCVVLCVVPGNL
jgi:hypothetical protein